MVFFRSYTGEDGVEISIPADRTCHVTEAILESKSGKVKKWPKIQDNYYSLGGKANPGSFGLHFKACVYY
jgi:hypothetical protein